jgi:hypothetical protein
MQGEMIVEQTFFDWYKTRPSFNERPWLILGKGPSYSKLSQFDTSGYNKVSLNHVIRDQRVTVAHIIDLDVALDCAEEIDRNSEVLVMPWWPHVKNNAGTKTLYDSLREHPVLNKLVDEGRVKYYNLASGRKHQPGVPVIPTNFFSSEAVVNLLTIAGVSKIRTIGVDGGNTYSPNFKDLSDKTLLANGHSTFDIQFKSIAKKIMKDKLDYAPIDVESPVKVYVGSQEEQMLAVKVLEYSIRKNASLPVEVMPLFKSKITYPMPKEPSNRPRTPFSFQRFTIPELNGFKGKAIYVDSDMQVFVDIKDLWARDMKGVDILSASEMTGTTRRPQFSVMLLNCDRLQWSVTDIVNMLDRGELNYEQLMYEMRVARSIEPSIEKEWNSLEHYDIGKTKLLHYTDMTRQPWLFRNNPLTVVWLRELAEAIDEGFISWSEVRHHILAINVRPSIWYQLKRRSFDPAKLPGYITIFDSFFVAPHERTPATSKVKLALNRLMGSILTRIVPGKNSVKRMVKKALNA